MKKHFLLFLIPLSLAFIGCADPSASQLTTQDTTPDQSAGIMGGVEFDGMTDIRSTTVMLKYFDRLKTQLVATCSGTLVAENIVLTAAHCAAKEHQDLLVVFTNTEEEFLDDGAFGIAKKFVKHPDYQGETAVDTNDIALIKFTVSKGLPKGFKARQLPEDKSYDVSSFVMAGAGLDSPYGTPGTLRFVSRPVSSLIKSEGGLMIFNQLDGEGICGGDSGGPLFIERNRSLTLVGITSFTMNAEGKCGHAGFVNIRPHLSWIKKTMAALQTK